MENYTYIRFRVVHYYGCLNMSPIIYNFVRKTIPGGDGLSAYITKYIL